MGMYGYMIIKVLEIIKFVIRAPQIVIGKQIAYADCCDMDSFTAHEPFFGNKIFVF